MAHAKHLGELQTYGHRPMICVPPPFDGNLLIIMPWPRFQDMTTHDIHPSGLRISKEPLIYWHFADSMKEIPRKNSALISTA